MEVKKGVLYGVSVGPGDPELLTVKAVRVLERCGVIAAPQTRSGGTLALDIVRRAVSLEGKTILPLFFPMGRDREAWWRSHRQAAAEIQAHLDQGRDVAMPNLGDVSIYSTFGYLMELLREKGYEAVMIPGVPSFCASAARLGVSLCNGEAPLHIVPVSGRDLDAALDWPGAKVLMKAGGSLPEVAEALRRSGQLERAALVEDCGLPTERICLDLTENAEKTGYFATVIVKEQ